MRVSAASMKVYDRFFQDAKSGEADESYLHDSQDDKYVQPTEQVNVGVFKGLRRKYDGQIGANKRPKPNDDGKKPNDDGGRKETDAMDCASGSEYDEDNLDLDAAAWASLDLPNTSTEPSKSSSSYGAKQDLTMKSGVDFGAADDELNGIDLAAVDWSAVDPPRSTSTEKSTSSKIGSDLSDVGGGFDGIDLDAVDWSAVDSLCEPDELRKPVKSSTVERSEPVKLRTAESSKMGEESSMSEESRKSSRRSTRSSSKAIKLKERSDESTFENPSQSKSSEQSKQKLSERGKVNSKSSEQSKPKSGEKSKPKSGEKSKSKESSKPTAVKQVKQVKQQAGTRAHSYDFASLSRRPARPGTDDRWDKFHEKMDKEQMDKQAAKSSSKPKSTSSSASGLSASEYGKRRRQEISAEYDRRLQCAIEKMAPKLNLPQWKAEMRKNGEEPISYAIPWETLDQLVDLAETPMDKILTCHGCGGPVHLRKLRGNAFLGVPQYPNCTLVLCSGVRGLWNAEARRPQCAEVYRALFDLPNFIMDGYPDIAKWMSEVPLASGKKLADYHKKNGAHDRDKKMDETQYKELKERKKLRVRRVKENENWAKHNKERQDKYHRKCTAHRQQAVGSVDALHAVTIAASDAPDAVPFKAASAASSSAAPVAAPVAVPFNAADMFAKLKAQKAKLAGRRVP